MQYHAAAIALVGAMIAIGAFGSARGHAQGTLPATVQFPSADGTTTLTGFVYMPKDKRAERAPAVVMMHGRAGPYSTNVKNGGPYNASTLSKRHKMWVRAGPRSATLRCWSIASGRAAIRAASAATPSMSAPTP